MLDSRSFSPLSVYSLPEGLLGGPARQSLWTGVLINAAAD